MKIRIILVLFLVTTQLGYAQLFQQDFSSSTVVGSYVNLAAPSANQFNAVSNFANSPSSITNGALRFNKIGASSAYFVRSTNFAVTPSFVSVKFKFRVSNNVTGSDTDVLARFFLGKDFTNDVTQPADATQVHTKFAIMFDNAEGAFKIRDLKAGESSSAFFGWQQISLFVNNYGSTKTYLAPDGSTESLANDKWDLWIGTAKVFNDADAQTKTVDIKNFKFVYPSSAINATIDIDDFEIRNDIASPPALWISEVKYQDPATGIYLGSPSLIRLDNGDILASHDYFGPNRPRDLTGRSNQSSVYKSSDNGQSWTHLTDITGIYWATLFEHRGAIYLLGNSAAGAHIVIMKSTDNGLTWTVPVDSSSGLLFAEGADGNPPRYGGAPTPVVKHKGRLYRAFENTAYPEINGYGGLTLLAISIDEDDDLLDASKWAMTNQLTFNRAWDPPGSGSTTGWLEGNIVVGPDDTLWNMLRVNSTPFFDRSALAEITNNGQTISFDPSDFINFPGGSCKFVVRKDMSTNVYWAMLNDNTNGVEPNQRNVLALYASLDLRNWYHAKTLMEDDQGYSSAQSIELTGFQYPDWQFDGDNMIYLSRTAYGDGVPRAHDSNYITFGRVENYRSYTPQTILDILGSLNNYGKLFHQDFESGTDKEGYIGSGPNQFGSIYSTNSSNTISVIETESGNKFLRLNKTGNATSVVTRGASLNNASSIAVLKFKLRFIPSAALPVTQSEILAFFLGDATTSYPTTVFDNNNTSVPLGVNVFGNVSLRAVRSDAEGKIIYDNTREVSGYQPNTDYVFVSAMNSFYPASEWNELTVIANRGTSVLPYKGPNGLIYNLAAGKQSVWIGTTQAVASGTLTANAELTTFNKFKLSVPSGFPNGTIDIDDIRIYSDVSVLPVTLTSFTGKQVGSSVQLNWRTVSESNNSHFNVLRAGENGQFNKIGELKCVQNTNVGASYSFTDHNPVLLMNYYKLQQVDIDNTVNEYGEIVAVNIGSSSQGENLLINSFEDGSFNVVFHATKEIASGKIVVMDVLGRQLISKQLKVNKGYNEVRIDQYLPKGVYVVSFYTEGKTISAKFIK